MAELAHLTPRYFAAHDLHSSIWRVMQQMHGAGGSFDPMLVARAHVLANGETGGLHQYLAELVESAVAPELVLKHAKVVEDCYERRELARIGEELAINADSEAAQRDLAAHQRRCERKSALLVTRRADAITPEAIRWLWPDRVALGKISVIAGHPGTGKSQVSCDIVARVTRGGHWPVDLTAAPSGSAVILSAEDDPADTIIPRLTAAGADLSRVHLVEAIRTTTKNGVRGVDLSKDIGALSELLIRIGDVAVIVVDPITAYLGYVDAHNNAEVRSLLMPLAALGAEHGAAILLVTHLRKAAGSEALLAVMGSVGFVAAARATHMVVKDAADPTRRLLLPAKNNIGPETSGLAYRLVSHTIDGGIETSRVEWDREPVSISADDAFQAAANGTNFRTERDSVGDWLRTLLSPGSMSALDVQREATAAGHSWATVRRAKDAIHVRVKRAGYGKGGAWRWSLPGVDDRAIDVVEISSKNVSAYEFNGECEHVSDTNIDAQSPTIESIDAQDFVAGHDAYLCDCCGEGCDLCRERPLGA